MKITLHKIIAVLLFTGSYMCVNAQAIPDTLRISIGVDAGMPNSDIYSSVLGGSLRIDYPITRKLYVTATGGFNQMFISSKVFSSPTAFPQSIANVKFADLQTVPIKVGIKYFAIRHFYLLGEVGETLLLNKAQAFATYNSSLTFSPQMGMLFFLKKRNYIDAGIRYESVKSFNNDNEKLDFWAAHIAFAFNL